MKATDGWIGGSLPSATLARWGRGRRADVISLCDDDEFYCCEKKVERMSQMSKSAPCISVGRARGGGRLDANAPKSSTQEIIHYISFAEAVRQTTNRSDADTPADDATREDDFCIHELDPTKLDFVSDQSSAARNIPQSILLNAIPANPYALHPAKGQSDRIWSQCHRDKVLRMRRSHIRQTSGLADTRSGRAVTAVIKVSHGLGDQRKL